MTGTTRTILVLLALVLAASIVADAAEAKSKRQKHKRIATPPPTELWHAPGARQQPARMIEVRPGLWISSYGCIQDEGYGRYSSCDITDGLH